MSSDNAKQEMNVSIHVSKHVKLNDPLEESMSGDDSFQMDDDDGFGGGDDTNETKEEENKKDGGK
eukprot:CAMPEP_0119558622 /NCGR_PEP_ID=MMETSP1352-20130426/10903_1 /TAXON_ID=265584 /ORGANISM="Stauroneis constricta, Strain CCMP1120" /LENGTH=64 /DNA_ID=CAMNT_0007606029 /DNA_START=128 /DNA_END=322 /DNA_ORIENTATION=-